MATMTIRSTAHAGARAVGVLCFGLFVAFPAFSFYVMYFDDEIQKWATGEPVVNHLELKELYFEDGKFHQLMTTSERQDRPADWSASIFKGNEFVCGAGGEAVDTEPGEMPRGHGKGTYGSRTEPAVFTPSQWTGDDCPELIDLVEYQARASWSYTGEDGEEYSLTRSFEFTPGIPESSTIPK